MIAATVSRKSRAPATRRTPSNAATPHDLPVLGATLAPTVRIDWERLLEDGVTPCLALGAERRTRGPR